MLKKDLLLSAALGAALVSFSGATLAADAQKQPSQAQMQQPSSPGGSGAGGPAGAAPESTPGSGGPAGAAPESGGAGDTAGALTAKEGMDVVNAKGDKIGEVERIEGDKVIVSVGGFLGIGARDVALDRKQLQSMGAGDEAKLQTSMTAEELEKLPEASAAKSGATGGAGGGSTGGAAKP